MGNRPRYWSREFVERFVRELERDPSFQKAARSFRAGVILRCTDRPDGMDATATYRIDHGRVTVHLEEEEAPSTRLRQAPFDPRDALARTTAPYGIWERLDRGEMSVLQTLTSPQYVLEGPKLKVIKNIGVFNAMGAVASRIPKEY